MFDSADILGARILIVDDQDASVRLLELMLRRVGYSSVTSTTDPYEVSELHRRNRYDLILLDLKMPGLDGFQVLAGLAEVEQEGYLSVLVMTAYPAHKQRALDAGAKDFVSKPFKPVEVMTRVHNLLELRLLHRKDRSRRRRAPAAPRTVLYVEDNAANLKLVEQLIARRPDLRLLSAQDGSLGVALARASQPEVILMDINLPGITGTRALAMLRGDPATAGIPVVALSASSSPRDMKKGLAAGFFRYLGKPLQIAAFTDALDAALAVAEQRALVGSARTVAGRVS
jgi:CheY-like chemotaxis protein